MIHFFSCFLGNRPHGVCVTGKTVDVGDILSDHRFPPFILCTDISCKPALTFLFITDPKKKRPIFK